MADEAELARILADGLRLWDERRFFECHDKLEEAWQALKQEKKSEPPKDPRRDFVHGVILLSAAYVHWQRGNRVGIERKLADAERLFRSGGRSGFGIDPQRLDAVEADLRRGIQGTAYDPERAPRLS